MTAISTGFGLSLVRWVGPRRLVGDLQALVGLVRLAIEVWYALAALEVLG